MDWIYPEAQVTNFSSARCAETADSKANDTKVHAKQ